MGEAGLGAAEYSGRGSSDSYLGSVGHSVADVNTY